MALNSAVTIDGGEIGRAQALQALAAGVPAHSDMNPVLIKPSSDTGAQIIIHGQVRADMNARDYHQYKTTAMSAVLQSYQRLQAQYDVVMVEGAGSPAEINLRENDIVNMEVALAAQAACLLVTDIDRGSEALIVAAVREARPHDGIVGEEGWNLWLALAVGLVDEVVPLDQLESRVMEQAQRMHAHLRRLFERPALAGLVSGRTTDRRLKLTNGSEVELLAQSQVSVRGT